MMTTTFSSLSKRLIRHLVPNVGTIVLLALFVWAQAAGAFPFSAPQGPTDLHISYQGRLTGADGLPLTGSYPMAVTIYTVPSGGTPFWSEMHPTVTVNDGLFSVLLGSVDALPNPLPAGNLYLGITIGNEEITPRQLLSSSYHALEATHAQEVAAGAVGTAQLADDAVTTAKIPNGAITDAKLASPVVTQSWQAWCLTPHATLCGASVVSNYENVAVGSNQMLRWTLPYTPFAHTMVGSFGRLDFAGDGLVQGSVPIAIVVEGDILRCYAMVPTGYFNTVNSRVYLTVTGY